MKCIIVGAGSNAAEVELWADKAANGQWEQLCPRTKGIGGFFPSSAEQECTIRIDGATQIAMHCSAVQEISGWTKGAGGAALPSAPAPTPTQTTEEPQPESGGGGRGSEESSNYARSYRSRVRYY
jgi:hypothetical protein